MITNFISNRNLQDLLLGEPQIEIFKDQNNEFHFIHFEDIHIEIWEDDSLKQQSHSNNVSSINEQDLLNNEIVIANNIENVKLVLEERLQNKYFLVISEKKTYKVKIKATFELETTIENTTEELAKREAEKYEIECSCDSELEVIDEDFNIEVEEEGE